MRMNGNRNAVEIAWAGPGWGPAGTADEFDVPSAGGGGATVKDGPTASTLGLK